MKNFNKILLVDSGEKNKQVNGSVFGSEKHAKKTEAESKGIRAYIMAKQKINRRNLLKLATIMATSAVVGKGVIEIAENIYKDDDSNELTDEERKMGWEINPKTGEKIYTPPSDIEPGYYEATERETGQEMMTDGGRLFRDIFMTQVVTVGKISINKNIKKRVATLIERQHSKDGHEYRGLKESVEKRLMPWYKEIKQEFTQIFEEEKLASLGVKLNDFLEFIYLAIPESHCRTITNSKVGAVGWWQIMKVTATGKKRYGGLEMTVDKKIDERYDVLANAKGAALYLTYWYKKFRDRGSKDEDAWNLTLARYNGGHYFNNFKGITYEEFLAFREKTLNEYLQEIFKQGYFENYKVGKGETLDVLAGKFNLNFTELKHLNGNSVNQGDRIKIPIFRSDFQYKVESGDTLTKIAKRYGTTVSKIMADNKLSNDKIYPKNILKIIISDKVIENLKQSLEVIFKEDLSSAMENLTYPEGFFGILKAIKQEGLLLEDNDDKIVKRYTTGGDLKKEYKQTVNLLIVSRKLKINLKLLRKINPHILNSETGIPDGIRVYFPDIDIAKKVNK